MKKNLQKPLIYFVGANPTQSQQQLSTTQPIQQKTNNYFQMNPFLFPEILQRPNNDFKVSKENTIVTASSRKHSNSPLPILKKQTETIKQETEKIPFKKPPVRKKSPKIEKPLYSPKPIKEKSNSQERLHPQRSNEKLKKISSLNNQLSQQINCEHQTSLPIKIVEIKEESVNPSLKEIDEEEGEKQSCDDHDSKWYEKKMTYYDQQRVKLKDIIKRQASSVENKIKISKPKQLTLNIKKELDEYQLGPILGQGSYAMVKLGIHKFTKEKVAIKMYDKGRLFDPQRLKNVQKEIEILRKCEHPNIISLIKVIETEKQINLVMSFGGNTSLKQLLKQKKDRRLKLDEARDIFGSLIKAVRYLHGQNIIHRDIKLENILLDNHQVRLIDLGFATQIGENNYLSQSCGTPPYMSPELLPPNPQYRQGVDIWSCGVVLYLMVKGRFPFKANTEKELFIRIKKQELIDEQDLPNEVWEMIKGCLEKDVKKRKTAQEIVKCLWIQGYE